jgi:hypothetical protein
MVKVRATASQFSKQWAWVKGTVGVMYCKMVGASGVAW